MKRLLGATLAFLLAALLLPAAPASAHADYERSEPARDEVLAQAPARVDVWFTQEVFRQAGSNFVRVFDENDAQVSSGDGAVDDDDRTHIFAGLPAGLADGRYIVRWKTLSDADGDEDEGAFCFYAGVEPTAEQQAECAAFAEEEATPSAGAVATATPAGAGPTPTAVAPADGDDDGGVSRALIVVAAVAGVAVVLAVAGGAIIWFRRTLE